MPTTLHSRRTALTTLTASAMGGTLLLASVPAQAWQLFGGKKITPSGRTAMEARTVGPFHALAMSIPGTVELIQGGGDGLKVEADDNLMPVIETLVDNGALLIRLTKGVQLSGSSRIRVTVHASIVDRLSVSGSASLEAARLQTARLEASIAGSGHIAIRDLQNEQLSVSIAGSGDFEASGTGQVVDVSIAGSGNMHAPTFSTRNASVSIAGSGNATLWVRQSLSASIVGSGDVRYYGKARPLDNIVGSGRIRFLGDTPPTT